MKLSVSKVLMGVSLLVKFGKTKSGNQRYICKRCSSQCWSLYSLDSNQNISLFTKKSGSKRHNLLLDLMPKGL